MRSGGCAAGSRSTGPLPGRDLARDGVAFASGGGGGQRLVEPATQVAQLLEPLGGDGDVALRLLLGDLGAAGRALERLYVRGRLGGGGRQLLALRGGAAALKLGVEPSHPPF